MNVQHVTQKYSNFIKEGKHGVRCHYNKIPYYYPLHHHNYIEIEILASGCFEHVLNGNKILCTSGSCWCLDTSDLHMFTVLEPLEIYSICLVPQELPESVQRLLNTCSFPLKGYLEQDKLQKVATYFENLLTVTDNDCPLSKEKTTAYILLILAEIIENSESLATKAHSNSYEHISHAIKFISQNFSEPISLTDTARAIHLSPNHLSKIFSEISGSTFLNFLTNIRIDKATELLSNTDTSLTDISMSCGFGSPSAFSRTFRKYKGCSPSEYRELKKKFRYVEQ